MNGGFLHAFIIGTLGMTVSIDKEKKENPVSTGQEGIKCAYTLDMATTPNTVGTHSDTSANDEPAVLRPSWLSAVSLSGVTLKYTNNYSVSLYEFDGQVVWSIYDFAASDEASALIKWQYGKDNAYRLIHSIMKHDGVTNESVARLVWEVRFLTS